MKAFPAALALGFLNALAFAQARASLLVTYEQPGTTTSSLVNASTFTFDDLSTGIHTNVLWQDVGTFDQLNIHRADQYGGAGGNTNYAVEGLGLVNQTILNLDHSSGYFGLWLSAGDAANELDFYSGANGTGTLLGKFTTANLFTALPSTYYGNPSPGMFNQSNTNEAYAFLNFFGTEGTSWGSVVFNNPRSSGLEADNYTSRIAAYDPATEGKMPGMVLEAINGNAEIYLAQAPEPSAAFAMLILGSASVGGSFLRRIRK